MGGELRASSGCLSNESCKHPAIWDPQTEKLFSRAQWPLNGGTMIRTIKANASLSCKLAGASRKVPVSLNIKCLKVSQA